MPHIKGDLKQYIIDYNSHMFEKDAQLEGMFSRCTLSRTGKKNYCLILVYLENRFQDVRLTFFDSNLTFSQLRSDACVYQPNQKCQNLVVETFISSSLAYVQNRKSSLLKIHWKLPNRAVLKQWLLQSNVILSTEMTPECDDFFWNKLASIV